MMQELFKIDIQSFKIFCQQEDVILLFNGGIILATRSFDVNHYTYDVNHYTYRPPVAYYSQPYYRGKVLQPSRSFSLLSVFPFISEFTLFLPSVS